LTQVGGDLTELLDRAETEVVLNAVVGFAGLPATLWALEHGVDLALANKESLVAAGELALAAQRRGGGLLLPVDSEHSAAFQCLEGRASETVDSLVLTASGGPFRGRTRDELQDVTPEDALALASRLTRAFQAADPDTFRLLALARQAGEKGGTYPCAYNAANEVAVAAFLDGRLPFLAISEVVAETLAAVESTPARALDDL